MTTRFLGKDVSVVIPVLNHASLIGEAIDSVLAQTEPPGEVVVVDDASTDGSGDVASAYGAPVRVVRNRKSGIASARNTGVDVSSGALIAFLDADDRWTPNKLRRQLEVLTDEVDLVSGWTAQVPQLRWEQAVRDGPTRDMWRPGAVPGTLLIRRTLFERVGPYNSALRAGESLDWHARATHLGARWAVVPGVVLLRRVHANSHGTREREAYVDYLSVVRMAVARRRQREPER